VGEFSQWLTVTRHQLAHYVRTYRFLGLLGFVVLVSGLTVGLQLVAGVEATRIAALERTSEYETNFLEFTGLWIALSAALFAGDALSVDFSTGAGYHMLVLPVRRTTLLVGRYTAALIVTMAIVSAYYTFCIVGASYFFGSAVFEWVSTGVSLLIAALFALAALAIAFSISAFFRSPAAGVVVTLLTIYVGFSALQGVLELAGYEPWFFLTYAAGAITTVTDRDFAHFQRIPLGPGQYATLWQADFMEAVVVMIAYLVVFFVLSAFLYERQESMG